MSQDCKTKMDLFISDDDKLKRIREVPEVYDMVFEKMNLIAENAEMTAQQRKEVKQALLDEAFTRTRMHSVIKADNALKRVSLVKGWMEGLTTKFKDPKEAVMSLFERRAGKVDSLETRAHVYEGELTNALTDNILKNDVMEFANKDMFGEEISEVIFTGKDHVGDNAEIINKLAKIYNKVDEHRLEILNGNGAQIKKRDGHVMSRVHNGALISKAGYQEWSKFMKENLDTVKSYGNGTAQDVEANLKRLYDEAITSVVDVDNMSVESYMEEARRSSGSGVASAEKARKLHFKSGKAEYQYNKLFGNQETLYSYHMTKNRAAARSAVLLQTLGHNPKDNLEMALSAFFKHGGAKLSAGDKMAIEKNAIEALDVFTGKSSIVADMSKANVGAFLRNIPALAQLGKAITASMLYDPLSIAIQMHQNTGRSIFFTFPEAFMSNVGNLINGMSKEDRMNFAKTMAISINKMDEVFNTLAQADSTGINPVKTRDALNKMYKYTGADYANQTARITGVKAGIEDLRGIANGTTDPRYAKMFHERYGISKEELAKMSEANFDRSKMDNSVGRKFATFTNAMYNASSPGVDNRFKRQFLQSTNPGTLTGEIMRMLGQYHGASYRQMHDMGEVMRMAAPEYGINEGVGMMRYAVPQLASIAVWGTSMGIVRMYTNHLLSGKEHEDFDMFSARTLKGAIQGSGSIGGMIADLAVPLSAYAAGYETKAALYQHLIDFAAPAGSYGFNAVGVARDMTENMIDGDGFFSNDKQQQRFFRLLPFQNTWQVDIMKNYLIDAAMQ